MTEGSKTGPSIRIVPDGDDRERLTCPDCGFIHYENPKVIVGAVCEWEGKVLLCKRAIEPRSGYWTMPAGYMELNETAAEGAAREVWEEARAKVEIIDLLGVYDIPRISQVYLVYRAVMSTPDFAPGPESEEVGLFDWDAIPWDNLAFPSVVWSLEHYRDLKGQDVFSARSNSAEQAHTQRLR
ncbi:MAG: NUDIX hydrolase [Rhodospirillales bacterium]|nr:NUDIX hydrolase [Rhodospirillales bacterium]MCW8862866.1 NUDIX hydrolase [Rhodospirillales bacterium]MCW8952231.1 NUDIX hydrolase [Rhodospirillales bacterium]MCW8970109.1 NUDIX hydrolase [Rhodospirillales bacterium]MCW9001597.1 NUDIX hydrolase [Rhodospirillales bacterium]